MKSEKSKIVVIGSGFSGLAASTCLAQSGHDVTVVEKHDQLGGRARMFQAEGFKFDMGPSWYWMPEVFQNYFKRFGRSVSDFYQLKRLDPSYQVFFENDQRVNIPAGMGELEALFEEIEPGSSMKLRKFLSEAEYKYKVGMDEFVWKPSLSVTEFMDFRILKSAIKLQMFSSISSQIRSLFKDSRLVRILEFPVLFLGAKAQDTPALYSLMNYADLQLGTWYPMGGMHKIVEGMAQVAKDQGVKFELNQDAQRINYHNNKATSLTCSNGEFEGDCFVSSADYEFTDRVLLGEGKRNYSQAYWEKRKMAPSSLLFYLGLDTELSGLTHHNLFFDEDFEKHANEIYKTPKYPDAPLFYACVPSKTDDSVAPKGCENLFILIPLAPGLDEDVDKNEYYLNFVSDKLKKITGVNIKEHLLYKRVFSVGDFKSEYNSFKGNAYGLANTLNQTAILKPRIKSRKLSNFYYTGQLSTPGPGVPPSLISGQVVAKEIDKIFLPQ